MTVNWKLAKDEKPKLNSTVIIVDDYGNYEVADYTIIKVHDDKPHFFRWVSHFDHYLDDWECIDYLVLAWDELPNYEKAVDE